MTSREVRSAPSKYKDRTGREARWFLRMGCKNYSLHNDLRFNSIYVAWEETIEEPFSNPNSGDKSDIFEDCERRN